MGKELEPEPLVKVETFTNENESFLPAEECLSSPRDFLIGGISDRGQRSVNIPINPPYSDSTAKETPDCFLK
jgi:hypothetical protein